VPNTQELLPQLNWWLEQLRRGQLAEACERLGRSPAEVRQHPDGLVAAMRELPGLPVDERAYAALDAVPRGIKAAITGLLVANLSRERPFTVCFAWAPAYDHGLEIWEAAATEESEGGITILLKGRYPLDRHPMHRRRGDTA
jgi:hypothetical protein